MLTGQEEKLPSPESVAEHYEKQTKALEAQDNFLITKDRLANPPSVQEIRAKHEAELEKKVTDAEVRARDAEQALRSASEDRRKEAEEAAAKAQQEAQTAKDELHNHQIQMLSDKLTELLSQKKSPQDQFTEYFGFAETLLGKLGYVKPGTVTPASENPQIALEIAKLNLDAAREERKFQLDMEQRKREWDIKLLELQQQSKFKERELELNEKKAQQFFALPEILGGSIAQGLVDHAAGGAPIRRSANVSTSPEPVPSFHVEVGEGEGGDFECPSCHGRIGIGPTSTEAVCLNCNTRLPVQRKAPVATPPEEEGTI